MQKEIKVPVIGYVKSKFPESTNPVIMRREESLIIINEEFEPGLFKIEDSKLIDIMFCFHKSDGYKLKTHTFTGEYKGVFASRSPRSPSGIGYTTVRLLERNGRELKVSGLDALDGSPVIDIKPYFGRYTKEEIEDSNEQHLPWQNGMAVE